MKLSNEDIKKLTSILTACSIGGIESIIIDELGARGVDEARTFVILSKDDVPKFPQKIGLSRLSSLRQRIELFADNSATVIQALESDRGEISSIDIAAGRNKAQFRCTSTTLIKAPKSVNHVDSRAITLSKDEIKLVLSAIKTMGSKTVQVIMKKNGEGSIVVTDDTNDGFTVGFEAPVEVLSDDPETTVHYYHSTGINAALREHFNSNNSTARLVIGETGSLLTKINGHTVYLLPKINEDAED